MKTIEQRRESDAKAEAAFFAGETDWHPHGQSARATIIDGLLSSRADDTSRTPGAFRFSEYGNLAGWVGEDHGPTDFMRTHSK